MGTGPDISRVKLRLPRDQTYVLEFGAGRMFTNGSINGTDVEGNQVGDISLVGARDGCHGRDNVRYNRLGS